jgi:hypothetical protein
MQRIPRLSAPGRGVHSHQRSAGDQYDRLWRQRQREIAGFYGDAAGIVHGFVYAGSGEVVPVVADRVTSGSFDGAGRDVGHRNVGTSGPLGSPAFGDDGADLVGEQDGDPQLFGCGVPDPARRAEHEPADALPCDTDRQQDLLLGGQPVAFDIQEPFTAANVTVRLDHRPQVRGHGCVPAAGTGASLLGAGAGAGAAGAAGAGTAGVGAAAGTSTVLVTSGLATVVVVVVLLDAPIPMPVSSTAPPITLSRMARRRGGGLLAKTRVTMSQPIVSHTADQTPPTS